MKIKYYNSFEDDFVKNKNQNIKLKNNYKWIHKNIIYNMISYLLYILVLIIAFIYIKVILRCKYNNIKILKKEKGYFIYSNHTLTLIDALNPFLICFPNRVRIVCHKSNLGIPVIGKILPIIGAIAIPDGITKTKKFINALNYYSKKGDVIVIYPEAHLWPYCSFIRPFKKTSFHFPVDNDKKVFTICTTFKKSKNKRKPKIEYYIDGPIKKRYDLNRNENIKLMHNKVYKSLLNGIKKSNYNYIIYKKKD